MLGQGEFEIIASVKTHYDCTYWRLIAVLISHYLQLENIKYRYCSQHSVITTNGLKIKNL